MEIFGKAETGNIYAAAAFSFNLLMDNADLYYCTGVELKSGVIDQRWQRPITQPSLPVSFKMHFIIFLPSKIFIVFIN